MGDRTKVVKTAFKLLDLDHDGYITKDEFTQVLAIVLHKKDYKNISRPLKHWTQNKSRLFFNVLTQIRMEDLGMRPIKNK